MIAAFASAIGCPYAAVSSTTSSSSSTDSLAVLDALAAELEALRMALCVRAKAQAQAKASVQAASLENELIGLCRAVSVPLPRTEVLTAHPEKVLAMVSVKKCAQCVV
jgi:hypothetical protein